MLEFLLWIRVCFELFFVATTLRAWGMINLFNVSMDSASIGVGLIEFIFLVASSNTEHSCSIFVLSPSSGRSAIGYCFITYTRSEAALVTYSSGDIRGNVNLFDSA